MPFRIVEFEDTPNSNAVKCWLDRPISDGMRSFLDASAAEDDPIARALFAEVPLTNLLFGGDWLTINKRSDADWTEVKTQVAAVLGRVEGTMASA